MAMGRPQKPHKTAWGELVPGLYRIPNSNRWRIIATKQTYTESDERRAIQRYMNWKTQTQPGTISIQAPYQTQYTLPQPIPPTTTANGVALPVAIVDTLATQPVPEEVELRIGYNVPESIVWLWLKDLFATRPDYVAKQVGIPELANVKYWDVPKAPIKLSDVLQCYKDHADVKADSKREASKTFEDFTSITHATTLDDLTTEALAQYRDAIRKRVKSPGTIAAYFGRVKWIIKFAKSEGMDARQVDAALSRMSVLKAPKDKRTHQPTPISRKDFHSLYNKAKELYPEWELRLLLMLNLCLHFDECLDLEWDDFNLDNGTFCTHRNKTGRVIRAATLWDETITGLKQLPRKGMYIFTSAHGTRYNAKGQWKTWDKLRTLAGCPDVQLDSIRDGSYTAACNAAGVEERFARLLAGHRSHGLQDNYVQRHPAIVQPACDAVYRHYGPFGAARAEHK